MAQDENSEHQSLVKSLPNGLKFGPILPNLTRCTRQRIFQVEMHHRETEIIGRLIDVQLQRRAALRRRWRSRKSRHNQSKVGPVFRRPNVEVYSVAARDIIRWRAEPN